MAVIVLLVWAAIGAVVGYAIGAGKGRAQEGVLLGFFLGFIGWIIVAVMEPSAGAKARQAAEVAGYLSGGRDSTDDRRPCPYCAELIKKSAVVCRFCGRDIEPVSAAETAAVADWNTDWDCQRCGVRNWAAAYKCRQCGTGRQG